MVKKKKQSSEKNQKKKSSEKKDLSVEETSGIKMNLNLSNLATGLIIVTGIALLIYFIVLKKDKKKPIEIDTPYEPPPPPDDDDDEDEVNKKDESLGWKIGVGVGAGIIGIIAICFIIAAIRKRKKSQGSSGPQSMQTMTGYGQGQPLAGDLTKNTRTSVPFSAPSGVKTTPRGNPKTFTKDLAGTNININLRTNNPAKIGTKNLTTKNPPQGKPQTSRFNVPQNSTTNVPQTGGLQDTRTNVSQKGKQLNIRTNVSQKGKSKNSTSNVPQTGKPLNTTGSGLMSFPFVKGDQSGEQTCTAVPIHQKQK